MSVFPRRFLVATVTVFLVGVAHMPPVSADSPASTCNSGNPVNATLKVDGVSVPINASGSTYALTVCRVLNMQYYSIMVGLYDFGVLKEELTTANLEKTYEVTFTPTTGDTPTVADFYGRVQTYVIGSNVVVSVKPTGMSKVDDPNRVCDRKEFSDATCVARVATRDVVAFVVGSVRFDTSTSISNYSKLAGATVSASANMYDISLSGPCPTATPTFSGNDGGVKRQASDTTTLTVQMVGPHFKLNGSTLNTGSLEVFIPKETITACFGGTATDLAASLGMTRTEAGVTADVLKTSEAPTTGLQYATTVTGDALKISVTAVSFSGPTYNLLLRKATVPATSNLTVLVAPVMKVNKATTAKSIATYLKMTVASGSKLSLKVAATSAKYCKVVGTSVKGVKMGSCKVTVTVTPQKGKAVSQSKTLTVS